MTKSRILALSIICFSFVFLDSIFAQEFDSAVQSQQPQAVDMNQLWQQGVRDLRANIQKIIKEKEFLKNNYKKIPIEEIIAKLGRTEVAINSMASKLQLTIARKGKKNL